MNGRQKSFSPDDDASLTSETLVVPVFIKGIKIEIPVEERSSEDLIHDNGSDYPWDNFNPYIHPDNLV